MAEDDIYKSKKKYERIVNSIESYTQNPKNLCKQRRYYIKNPENVRYFHQLFRIWAMQDISYIRRLRLFNSMLLITYSTNKILSSCCREDINSIIAFMHTRYNSPKSKADFLKDLRYIWKNILPELDIQGRIDETLVPYVVRHITTKIDKSREKRRQDKLTVPEVERLIQFFSQDIRMQAFLSLAIESLGRPQELLYLKISDVEIYDNYAKIWISEHGKEGTGFLRCIDSFPYVAKWLNQHPLRNDPKAFVFVSIASNYRNKQITPAGINKKIREACKALAINKPVTCYSLKRNGVTHRRLRGESDAEIQHIARWTSTRQLKTYDQSDQEDTFQRDLIRRGLIPPNKKYQNLLPQNKKCHFCHHTNGIAESICNKCMRPLDRRVIVEQEKLKEQTIQELQQQMQEMRQALNEAMTFSQQNLLEAQAQHYMKQNMPKFIQEMVKKDPNLLRQALEDH